MFSHIRRDDNRRCEKPTAPHYPSDSGLRVDDGVGPFHDKRQAPFWADFSALLFRFAVNPQLGGLRNSKPASRPRPAVRIERMRSTWGKCNAGQASLQAEMSAQVAFKIVQHLGRVDPLPTQLQLWPSLVRARAATGGRLAVERDEIAALYSITSSARASRVSGTVRPSVLAVLRLIARSYLVGAWTGRSAGFSPLRMRST